MKRIESSHQSWAVFGRRGLVILRGPRACHTVPLMNLCSEEPPSNGRRLNNTAGTTIGTVIEDHRRNTNDSQAIILYKASVLLFWTARNRAVAKQTAGAVFELVRAYRPSVELARMVRPRPVVWGRRRAHDVRLQGDPSRALYGSLNTSWLGPCHLPVPKRTISKSRCAPHRWSSPLAQNRRRVYQSSSGAAESAEDCVAAS